MLGWGAQAEGWGIDHTAAGKTEREDWVLRPRVLQGLRDHKSYLFSMTARQFYGRRVQLAPCCLHRKPLFGVHILLLEPSTLAFSKCGQTTALL